jgi:hypothetical protein
MRGLFAHSGVLTRGFALGQVCDLARVSLHPRDIPLSPVRLMDAYDRVEHAGTPPTPYSPPPHPPHPHTFFFRF